LEELSIYQTLTALYFQTYVFLFKENENPLYFSFLKMQLISRGLTCSRGRRMGWVVWVPFKVPEGNKAYLWRGRGVHPHFASRIQASYFSG